MSEGTYYIVSSLLLLGTLGVLIIYTAKTATIARAAIEQSEAAQKPCVVVTSLFMGRSDVRLPPTTPVSWDSWGSTTIVIANIGNGPALNVDFGFVDAPEEAHSQRERPLPYILPIDVVAGRNYHQTGCNPPAQGVVGFRITYESMSRTKYETVVEITSGENVTDFKFGRHPLRA
jgi:hypothetical protein